MGWVQVDDLSGEVIPSGHVHLLTLHLDDDEVRTWEVKVREDLDELLADLGEHLLRASTRTVAVSLDDEPWPVQPRPAPVDHERARALADQELAVEPTPDVATPAVDVTTRIGEANGGRATDATVRAWAVHHGVPASTTGGLKKWVREAYERVHGGAPDEQTWLDAGIQPRTPTPVPTSAGTEGDPAPDPDPRPGSAPATATTEPPERAGRPSEETPASDPYPPAGRAPAPVTSDGALGNGTAEKAPVPAPSALPERAPVAPIGDGDQGPRAHPEQIDLAHEFAADGATPMTICDRTGISLEEARAVHEQARRERAAR